VTNVELDSLRLLWSRLLTLPAVSSEQSPTSLPLEWTPPAEDASSRNLTGEPEMPDFGFQFATRLHECLASGRLRLLGRRGKRAFMRSCLAFGAIRTAVQVLDRRRRGDDQEEAWPAGLQAANAAIELHDDPRMRHDIQALLLARKSSPQAVADALGMDRAVLAAYADLFFNVIDRRNEPLFLPALAARLESCRDFRTGQPLPPNQAKLLAFASELTLGQVLAITGYSGKGLPMEKYADAATSLRLIDWNRQVLLSCREAPAPTGQLAAVLERARRAIGHLAREREKQESELSFVEGALMVIYYGVADRKKAGAADDPIEQISESSETAESPETRPPQGADAGGGGAVPDPQGETMASAAIAAEAAPDPEIDDREAGATESIPSQVGGQPEINDAPPDCAPLTPAGIRTLLPLWLPPPAPAATRMVPEWETPAKHASGREEPAIAKQPDFGFEFARHMAGRDQVESIPGDATFYWIRLAARHLHGGKAPGPPCGESDPGLEVVERAIQIHYRPQARCLLQAALFARGADIESVAGGLGLETRVVDAYAALFFNVIARCKDRGHIERIAGDLSAGKDPASGEPLPREQVKISRAAVHLTFEQWMQLIGCGPEKSTHTMQAEHLLRNLVDLAGNGLLCTDGMELRDLVAAVKIALAIAEAEPEEQTLGETGTTPRETLKKNKGIVEASINYQLAPAGHDERNPND
jgi:hypothetical protein